ncbi:uncharacterized protein VTP21DRAFT_3767 [Calcarisporiella thermophila]|uniref:uncharacterized protein n=1 Tax=Calcarisporiella thermophila TaxID=911321 RepID=UPI003741F6A3
MTAPLVNVSRWSALGLGVLYGAYHHSSLVRAEEKNRIDSEWAHKQALIERGRAEWSRLKAAEKGADGVVSDPEDPRFDLEKWIAHWEEKQ